MQEHEKIVIELQNQVLVLQLLPFDGNINVEDYLKIDYSNIMGECLTYSIILNRVGIMKAEIEDYVRECKFSLEILESQLKEQYRRILASPKTDSKGKEAIAKPTQDQVDTQVMLDKDYQIATRKFFKAQKDLGIVEALYWSAKSKDSKLNKFSEKVRPEEFAGELLIDTINGVLIKNTAKIFK